MNTQNYSEQQWQTLHEEIQRRFQALAIEVERLAPAVHAEFGKTVTSRFPLFSHVSFNIAPQNTRSDIIVGVDIGPDDGQWRIDADICNEEEGTIFFELPTMPFSVATFAEFQDRVLRITEQLIKEGKPALFRIFGGFRGGGAWSRDDAIGGCCPKVVSTPNTKEISKIIGGAAALK